MNNYLLNASRALTNCKFNNNLSAVFGESRHMKNVKAEVCFLSSNSMNICMETTEMRAKRINTHKKKWDREYPGKKMLVE